MTSDFTSFTIVFQSYQDGVRVIMKGCEHCNLFMDGQTSASSRAQTWTTIGQ